MNYQKIYDRIIEFARMRAHNDYTELHHIIPRCLGGNNSNANLVRLTYREHFLCHWLLCKIYPDNFKLKAAFAKMLESTKYKARVVTSKQFSAVKTALKDTKYPWLMNWIKDNGSWNKGKQGAQIAWNKGLSVGHATEDRKRKTSETLRIRYSKMQHHRKNAEPWNKGKTGAQEAWNKGVPAKKSPCVHCGKFVDIGNMRRWHGDKCKMRD
jgi:hypothetical protein